MLWAWSWSLSRSLRPGAWALELEPEAWRLKSALFFFYLLFPLRVLLRNQRAAALAFATIFALLDALDSERPVIEGATTFLYFAMPTAPVARWRLTTLAVRSSSRIFW